MILGANILFLFSIGAFFFFKPIKKFCSCCNKRKTDFEDEVYYDQFDQDIGEETNNQIENNEASFELQKNEKELKLKEEIIEEKTQQLEKKNEIIEEQENRIKKLIKEMEELRNKLNK